MSCWKGAQFFSTVSHIYLFPPPPLHLPELMASKKLIILFIMDVFSSNSL